MRLLPLTLLALLAAAACRTPKAAQNKPDYDAVRQRAAAASQETDQYKPQ